MQIVKMKNFLVVLLLFLAVGAQAQSVKINKVEEPVEWVNTLMGTDSKFRLSNGNTYPAIGMPWGMNLWTPQTGEMGNGWAYTYDADQIRSTLFKKLDQPFGADEGGLPPFRYVGRAE
jgi:putative alpha-1,2-mannosidase